MTTHSYDFNNLPPTPFCFVVLFLICICWVFVLLFHLFDFILVEEVVFWFCIWEKKTLLEDYPANRNPV